MADVVQKAKLKSAYIDRLNPARSAGNSGSEGRRRRAEQWEAISEFVRRGGGWVTSLPSASPMRLEVERDSTLPDQLAKLGFHATFICQEMRITGAPAIA